MESITSTEIIKGKNKNKNTKSNSHGPLVSDTKQHINIEKLKGSGGVRTHHLSMHHRGKHHFAMQS